MRRADNLAAFMCWLFRNSGSLNLLEPKGPVQAYNGIALPLRDIALAVDNTGNTSKKVSNLNCHASDINTVVAWSSN